MARIKHAVLDAGPYIHLEEVGATKALDVITQKFICQEVAKELGHVPPKTDVEELGDASKDFTLILCNEHGLDLGEAQSIALCRQNGVRIFLTDDLDARDVAKRFSITPHGSLGILLRALREGIINKEAAEHHVIDLQKESTLFLTSDLIQYVVSEIRRFRKQ
ncbi:hypothetical protein HY641_03320 [Candidatus Woesearchaeota archaeon]|nr:hypothetical protein [Candidatus Woesearchaeota archaeon]